MKPKRPNALLTGLFLAGWLMFLAAAGGFVWKGLRAGGMRFFLFAAIGLYFVYCLFAALLWIAVMRRKRTVIECGGEDILIVAPHQDDCVAIAGGYALQTLEKGGRVTVLYATDGTEDDKVTRKQEALDAWHAAGLGAESLHFLGHHILNGLVTREEIGRCTEEIAEWIRRTRPGTVFIPMYEGGNFQHDVVNYMVSTAVRRTGFKGRVYEAPEYNFFLSFRTTPEKILSGFMRFIPFVRHDYPPEPVLGDELLHLRMTSVQIEKKAEMLSRFRTQQPEQLVIRFGFEDRYQKLHDYDYRRPPFDYDRSAAKTINRLKAMPLLGKPVSRMFKWTKTIHPDPDTVMTRIPC
jgi:LmbE family N-acetylglucosaminyl deacetylase